MEPLSSLLEAKDARATLRRQMACLNRPSVSLSLNVPGFPKSNETVHRFFSICLKELRLHLNAHRISVDAEKVIEQTDPAGDFFIAPCSDNQASASDIKAICEDFEEKHALGRFIDVDVTDHAGNPVSSGKSKPCFYCGQRPAIECRREHAHGVDELRSFMFSRMDDYWRRRREEAISKHLASLALNAVLTEISLTPKPGLVDKFTNGCHTDMSYQTFLNSSAAITPWFMELALAGLRFDRDDLTEALPVIRTVGLQMESAMFASTHGVNTQKGLIFLLGISLFACGYLLAKRDAFDSNRFRKIVMQICGGMICRELEKNTQAGKTHGEEVYARYGNTGARGEAENGLPTVFEHGLEELMNSHELSDESLMRAFLAIAAHNNDTNILYRRNRKVLNKFKALAKRALIHYTQGNYIQLMDYCTNEHISPGGSADLLVVSVFLFLVMESAYGNGNIVKNAVENEF